MSSFLIAIVISAAAELAVIGLAALFFGLGFPRASRTVLIVGTVSAFIGMLGGKISLIAALVGFCVPLWLVGVVVRKRARALING